MEDISGGLEKTQAVFSKTAEESENSPEIVFENCKGHASCVAFAVL
jgi:hypothetical protein